MRKGIHNRSALFLLFIGAVFLLNACAYYSFTGATIPGHLQTIAVPLTEDRSGGQLPDLDDELTGLLTDQFVNRTRLALEQNMAEADVVLESQIESYTNQPTSVTGREQADLNRVTIRVSTQYYDQRRDSLLMEQTFTSFEEYEPRRGIDGEREAARAALETMASDIFTAATSNW